MSLSSNPLFRDRRPEGFRQIVQERVQHWKDLDNSPGDLDRRKDCVEISQGGVTLQAKVTPKKLAERTTLPNGDVTVVEVERPGFFRAGGAREVCHDGTGQFFGVNLEFEPNMGFHGQFDEFRMGAEEARTTFIMADSAYFYKPPISPNSPGGACG